MPWERSNSKTFQIEICCEDSGASLFAAAAHWRFRFRGHLATNKSRCRRFAPAGTTLNGGSSYSLVILAGPAVGSKGWPPTRLNFRTLSEQAVRR